MKTGKQYNNKSTRTKREDTSKIKNGKENIHQMIGLEQQEGCRA